MFTNRATFCQSLMVSLGMSKLVCTHLIFVDPGVKINGCYYTVRCFWINSCYLAYGRCLATSCYNKTGHARQSSCCNGSRPHSSHLICGLRIAQISTQQITRFGEWCKIGSTRKKVKDVNESRERLVEVWAGLQQNVIDDAIDQWRRRLHACRITFWVFIVTALAIPRIWFVTFVENLLICR